MRSKLSGNTYTDPSMQLVFDCADSPHLCYPGFIFFRLTGIAGWPEALGGKVFGSQPLHSSVKEFIHQYLVQDIGGLSCWVGWACIGTP